ncbi:hypothetical protein D3C74_476000 [compost metagenome]
MKVAVMAESMPAQEPSWQGTYRILVDKFKVYYSFSVDKRICFIKTSKSAKLIHTYKETIKGCSVSRVYG